MIYFIGTLNIITALLSSLQKFIRSTEKAEMHMHMNKIFSSFARKIILELALQPGDRKDCIEFCKICRDEYDKMITDSPQIPEKVISKFKNTFKHAQHIPEVANGLVHFETYKCTTEGSKHNAFIAMRAFYKWKSKMPFRNSSYKIPDIPLDSEQTFNSNCINSEICTNNTECNIIIDSND